jgi:hypothetical protein
VVGLTAFCASLHGGHPWCRDADRILLSWLDELQRRHETERRPDAFDRNGRLELRDALQHAARIDREGVRERLFDFAGTVLSPRARVRAGVELCEAGLARGRDLIVSGLEGNSEPDTALKARAMRCLLGSE